MAHRARSSASAGATAGEEVLKETRQLYTDDKNGLISISKRVSLSPELLPPREKITVLLIGNHSAGKSSFINWYVEEHIQKAGVAMETSGFTFVTSGRKKESLSGEATLELFPHFKGLADCAGVVDCITTEVSTSKHKRFPLLTFVDTPGLVDGDMTYPFDIEKSLLWLGRLADMVLVFFDPMGQALCTRMLNVVESLQNEHGSNTRKIKFYLSKADEAGSSQDRQKVIVQICQNLFQRPAFRNVAIDLQTICIPRDDEADADFNQIEQLCKDVDKTISQTVQNTLNTLEKDCKTIATAIDAKLAKDSQARAQNRRVRMRGAMLFWAGLMVPLAILLSLVLRLVSPQMLEDVIGPKYAATVTSYQGAVDGALAAASWQVLGGVVAVSLVLVVIAMQLWRTHAVLSAAEIKQFKADKEFVLDKVIKKKTDLYKRYLGEAVGPLHV